MSLLRTVLSYAFLGALFTRKMTIKERRLRQRADKKCKVAFVHSAYCNVNKNQ